MTSRRINPQGHESPRDPVLYLPDLCCCLGYQQISQVIMDSYVLASVLAPLITIGT